LARAGDVRIRSWIPEQDEAALLELFAAAFGQRRSAAHARWKYRENPSGQAEISLAEVDGRVASMACVLPMRMLIGGSPVMGSLSVDIATLPELRGRGLYVEVARHLWQRLADAGFTLTCGFTNRWSTAVTLGTLGRREVGALPLRVRPLDPLALARDLARGPATRGERALPAPDDPAIRPVEKFDGRFDALWKRLAGSLDVAAVRDARFLDWRYARHPERPYDVLALERDGALHGYVAWRALDRFGTRTAFVADLAAAPERPADARALLRAAASRARAAGATLLSLLSWPGSPVHRASARFAPLLVPKALFPQTNVFSAISHRADVATESLADPRRWWLAWGDSDVL
jgi:hypothetical protein